MKSKKRISILIVLFLVYIFVKIGSSDSADTPEKNNLMASDVETILYDTLKVGLYNYEPQISLSSIKNKINNEDVQMMIYTRIAFEDPEFIHFESCHYNSFSGSVTVTYRDEKYYNLEELRLKRDEIIALTIKKGMSDYEKVKAVHDYIVNNAKYNYDIDPKNINSVSKEDHNAYGVLINGIGVCDGYSKAMKYIMDKIGIECIVVFGQTSMNHAWNIVKQDGEYYHIDLTMAEGYFPGTPRDGFMIYDAYNLTDDEMALDHTWIRENYPACTSDALQYFKYNGMIVYSHEEYVQRILGTINKNEVIINLHVVGYDSTVYEVNATLAKIIEKNTNPNLLGIQVVHNPLRNNAMIYIDYRSKI